MLLLDCQTKNKFILTWSHENIWGIVEAPHVSLLLRICRSRNLLSVATVPRPTNPRTRHSMAEARRIIIDHHLETAD